MSHIPATAPPPCGHNMVLHLCNGAEYPVSETKYFFTQILPGTCNLQTTGRRKIHDVEHMVKVFVYVKVRTPQFFSSANGLMVQDLMKNLDQSKQNQQPEQPEVS